MKHPFLKAIGLLVYVAIICSSAGAQSTPFGGITFFKKLNFQLRQSLETADLKKEPGALTATFPKGKDKSYLVDAGVGVGYAFKDKAKHERFYLQLTTEYHRNTLIEKEQHNGQFGISGEWYLEPTINETNWVINMNPKYVRDVIASKGSFVFPVELTRYNATKKGFGLNSPVYLIEGDKSSTTFMWSPSVGLEYQNTFDAVVEKSDSLKGQIVRGLLKGDVAFRLSSFPTVVPLFEVYAKGILRYDIINTTQTPNGWHPYLDTGIRLFLGRVDNASVGLSYVTGEDPVKGLLKQKYWLLALKVFI